MQNEPTNDLNKEEMERISINNPAIHPPEEENLKDKIDKLLLGLQKSDIASYVEMYRHPFKMFGTNIWMGIGRGIGYLIGFAIGGTILVYILNQIVEINLPVIGDFIAQVVAIVQNQLGEMH